MYLHPGDFWHQMAERVWHRRCGQCHGNILAITAWHHWAPDVNALTFSHLMNYWDECWERFNTRRMIWALTIVACSSQLGALISVGPLALRIVAFLVDEDPASAAERHPLLLRYVPLVEACTRLRHGLLPG